jgi:dipeptidyl aminopeptidase/acylaminoacyl peptidase
MRKIFGALALCLAIFAPLVSARAADLASYGRLPTIEDIDLSPDGKQLAMILTDGEKRRVAVEDLDATQMIASIDAGTNKVRYIEWADSQNLIVVMSQTTNLMAASINAPTADYSVGLVFNVKDKTQRALLNQTGSDDTRLKVVEGRPHVQIEDGQTVAYVTGISFNDGEGVQSLFRVVLPNGTARLMTEGRVETYDYLVEPGGKVFAENLYADHTGKSGLLIRNSGSLKDVGLPDDFKGGLNLDGLSQDGKSALVSYDTETGWNVAEVTPEGKWITLPDAEDKGVMIDRNTGRMLGLVGRTGEELVYHFVDQQDQKAWRAIQSAYPGEQVTLAGYSVDHKRIVVLADSPTDGPAYALVDLATGKAKFIGSQYQGLKADDISPVEPIRFKAADGLDLHGYLTLPKKAGGAPKGLPLVVLAHGGPASRDDADFDWWSQALAAEGYAVLRVNFRGSSGYGRDFLKAGFGQWGKKMQTDLSDGVRYLATEGVIDPKRVCIVGASYGGYAALAGATLDRGVYRCAASVAGPADLRQMLTVARDDHGQTTLRYWNKFMGVDGVNDPNLAAISPAAHAGDVDIPILLIHGKDDSVVDYHQSQIMADALKKAGKPYDFVTLDGEDHWLSSGATRLKMLQTVVAFLQKNNPPN